MTDDAIHRMRRALLEAHAIGVQEALDRARSEADAEASKSKLRGDRLESELVELQDEHQRVLLERDHLAGVVDRALSLIAAQKQEIADKLMLQRLLQRWKRNAHLELAHIRTLGLLADSQRFRSDRRVFSAWRAAALSRRRIHEAEEASLTLNSLRDEADARFAQERERYLDEIAELRKALSSCQARESDIKKQMHNAFMRGINALTDEAANAMNNAELAGEAGSQEGDETTMEEAGYPADVGLGGASTLRPSQLQTRELRPASSGSGKPDGVSMGAAEVPKPDLDVPVPAQPVGPTPGGMSLSGSPLAAMSGPASLGDFVTSAATQPSSQESRAPPALQGQGSRVIPVASPSVVQTVGESARPPASTPDFASAGASDPPQEQDDVLLAHSRRVTTRLYRDTDPMLVNVVQTSLSPNVHAVPMHQQGMVQVADSYADAARAASLAGKRVSRRPASEGTSSYVSRSSSRITRDGAKAAPPSSFLSTATSSVSGGASGRVSGKTTASAFRRALGTEVPATRNLPVVTGPPSLFENPIPGPLSAYQTLEGTVRSRIVQHSLPEEESKFSIRDPLAKRIRVLAHLRDSKSESVSTAMYHESLSQLRGKVIVSPE